MATNKPVVPASFSDCGYQAARNSSMLEQNAAYMIDNCQNFPTEIQDSERVEFYNGVRLFYSESHPAVEYAVIDNNYVPVDQLPKDAKILERKKIGVEFAFSFTQHEAGQLAKTDKALHAIVSDIRKKTSKYCSDRINDVISKAKKIIAEREGKTKTRDQATEYAKWLDTIMLSIKARAKTATSRGDPTVPDSKKLDAAIAAFKSKLG